MFVDSNQLNVLNSILVILWNFLNPMLVWIRKILLGYNLQVVGLGRLCRIEIISDYIGVGLGRFCSIYKVFNYL